MLIVAESYMQTLKQGSLCILQQYAAESGASHFEDRKLPNYKSHTDMHADWCFNDC